MSRKVLTKVIAILLMIAFLLPYEKVEVSNGERRKVGLNVSGLLWNGGYTRDNQFGLKVNYQEYCKRIIDKFIEKEYEVHLILHAYSQNLSSADNDLCAMIELRKKYGDKVIYSPEFKTPMEAKSYIAAMDVFIGARMHATIGAFSAEVPVIPFSYSRKFEGLFHSLNYKFIVHGCEDTTEEAVEKTIMWVDDLSLLQDGMQKGKMLIFDLIDIGNKLYAIRKQKGLTQAQVAEEAGLSDRTYADIERGSVNMRIESVLKICEALGITPNDIFVEDQEAAAKNASVLERIDSLSPQNRETAMKLLEVYLNSLE